jgi:hypothetical protein
MKVWAYVSGGIFLVMLIAFSALKFRGEELHDRWFYLFVASGGVFFFTLAFAALNRYTKQ